MKSSIKYRILFILLPVIALLLSESSFLNNPFSHKHFTPEIEFSNIAEHLHSGTENPEDDNILHISKNKTIGSPASQYLIPIVTSGIYEACLSSVWQPPKNA